MARPDFLPTGFGTVARIDFEEVWVPPPIPMTPQTIGWWILAVILLAALLFVIYRRVRRYRANAYRRSALNELKSLRAAVTDDATRAAELPVLLKRAALGGFPRSRVARLTGQAWGTFLTETGPGAFTQATTDLLARLSFCGPDTLDTHEVTAVADAVEAWIRRHHVAV